MSIVLGAVADDLTGATDLADAVVVALKSGSFGAEDFFAKALDMLP